MTVVISAFPSDWGWLGIAVSERGLAGVVLPRPSEETAWSELRAQWPDGVREDASSHPHPANLPSGRFAPLPKGEGARLRLKKRLLDYLAGMPSDFSDVPLDLPDGPPFWRRVWEICARIPYGETRSYGDLAREAGSPRAFRAVGGAMAANPIPIVVPCHRVVGSDGGLTGFGGGLDQKKRMLQMEATARGG